MTISLHSPPRRRQAARLQDASLLDGPLMLLRSIRGFSSHRSLMWLACVPIALMGLGLFNLSAHAAEIPELSAAFLANNLWLLVATILVIPISNWVVLSTKTLQTSNVLTNDYEYEILNIQ